MLLNDANDVYSDFFRYDYYARVLRWRERGGGAHKNCGNFELGRLSKECVLSTNEIDFVSENHSFVLHNIQATFVKLNRILTLFNVMQVFISIQNESVL